MKALDATSLREEKTTRPCGRAILQGSQRVGHDWAAEQQALWVGLWTDLSPGSKP